MSRLFSIIEEEIPKLDGWASVQKCQILAASVIALRPEKSMEIGVYGGRGLFSLALAHKELGFGMAIGIDPWSPQASSEGQVNPVDEKWWKDLDHEMIYNRCLSRIEPLGIQNCVTILRSKSDDVAPPPNVGVAIIDGNHGAQAERDMARFCPQIRIGGLLYADDVDWTGGAPMRGVNRLINSGWVELYRLETGIMLQRLS